MTHGCVGFAALLAAGLGGSAPAGAVPLISEVYYDAVGSDDGQSFVELFGVAGASLEGLVIEVVNGADGALAGSLELSGQFGADGLFVVADRFADGTTAVAEADLLLNFDIQNGPDSLVLRGPEGVLDAVGFGEFVEGEVFAGEGSPAVDVVAGASLARVFADLDTGDNSVDFLELPLPTPGTAPRLVPEPASAALSAAGLVVLALQSRRAPPRPRSPLRRWRRSAPQT